MLSVKVLDFGISKVPSSGSGDEPATTRTGAIFGSPPYMSPEQLESAKDVDPRTDVWALGVILFQLTTGKLPFRAPTMPELMMKIVNGAPPEMRGLRPGLPLGFEHLVKRCLEKDRLRRVASVGELAVGLAEFAPPRARGSVDRILGMIEKGRREAKSVFQAPLACGIVPP